MKPLSARIIVENAAEVPLDYVLNEHRQIKSGRKWLPVAINEARFDTRINRDIKKLEKTYADQGKEMPGSITTPFEEGIEFLQQWYSEDVIPLADWQNKESTAGDVYEAIMMGWEEAHKRYDLDKEELYNIKERLDNVRQEWAENPIPFMWYNKKSDAYLEPDELYAQLERIEKESEREKERNRWTPVYTHRIGNEYGFLTEKEHLAGVMAWWLVAGLVGGANRMERRPDFGSIRWQMARDTGGTAKPDPELAAREKAAASAKAAKANKENLGSLVGEIPHTGGQTVRDPSTGKKEQGPVASAGGSVGRGAFNTGQTNTPPAKRMLKKKKPAEEAIARLADAISEDPNDTWRSGSPLLNEGWHEEYRALENDARELGESDPENWMPSNLADLPDYYASIVENGPNRFIFLSSNPDILKGHEQAGAGHMMYADEVPGYIGDDEWVMDGGQIIMLDEDIDEDGGIIAEETNDEFAMAEIRRKIGMIEASIEEIDVLLKIQNPGKKFAELRTFWDREFGILHDALRNSSLPQQLAEIIDYFLRNLRSASMSNIDSSLKRMANSLVSFLDHAKNMARNARSESRNRYRRPIREEDQVPVAGQPAAPPAAGQPATAQPATQPDPAIEQAKQAGGKLLGELGKQLQILQKAPDWATIKQDLVSKLKPYLG